MSTVADKLAKKSSRKTSSKQVRLRLVYIDFWSAVKLSFLGAVAIAIVTLVSFLLIYLVLDATQLIAKADEFVAGIADGAKLSSIIGLPQVLAFGSVVAILNLIVSRLEARGRRRQSSPQGRRHPPWRRSQFAGPRPSGV